MGRGRERERKGGEKVRVGEGGRGRVEGGREGGGGEIVGWWESVRKKRMWDGDE